MPLAGRYVHQDLSGPAGPPYDAMVVLSNTYVTAVIDRREYLVGIAHDRCSILSSDRIG